MQHIIIGAGPAGVIAAETLRKCDPDADITIIGDEPEPPYSRMAIPYYLIDNVDETGTYLRDPNSISRSRTSRSCSSASTRSIPPAKSVTLADGSTRSYDKLLIATGSHPVSPPIPGLDLPQVHSCWTLEDARNIIKLAQSGSNVVLIGAGFIGCIILEALVKRGVKLDRGRNRRPHGAAHARRKRRRPARNLVQERGHRRAHLLQRRDRSPPATAIRSRCRSATAVSSALRW